MKTTYENQVATLEINETTEKSAGTYSCKATNHLGSIETSTELKIQGKTLLLLFNYIFFKC